MAKSKKPSAFALWVAGARLRTLPLAIAPVLLGVGIALGYGKFNWLLSALALAVALLLQIGVNYANDYSDGIRGTDAHRVGPIRLTGSGAAKPKAVLAAALLSFALAGVAGLVIVVVTGLWWLLAVGAVSIISAWFYTGGKRPYGYEGLGELAVFVFFGLVATLGTSYIQVHAIGLPDLLLAVAAGLFATAVLLVNNIRDIATDGPAGKRTLALRIGAKPAKALFLAMIWLPFTLLTSVAFIAYPTVLIGWFSALLVAVVTVIVLTEKSARELILCLKLTSFAALAFAALVLVGLAGVGQLY